MRRPALAVLITVFLPSPAVAQNPANLLTNTAAESGVAGWIADGQATVEEFEGNHCFVLRNGARFTQEVDLPAASAGKFVLFIGHVFGERRDRSGDITDQPYLYGLTRSSDKRRVLLHNQAATMGGLSVPPGQWGKSWGVFKIPEDSSSISYQLGQGLRRGTDRNGSAARFDDLGLFIFNTREAADAFVTRYR
jgi:hypothetical protein